MYGSGFWKRANIQQICEYIRTGGETELQEGTPEERRLHHMRAFTAGMRQFRDNVLNYDWNSIENDEQARNMKTEELYVDAISAISDSDDLAFEMGFIAGIKIGQEITIAGSTKINDIN